MSKAESITSSQPFYSLDPLSNYLDTLSQVTESPTDENITRLMDQDDRLTSRAVLFPDISFVHREGYRVTSYHGCTASGGVQLNARLSLHEFGSQAYLEEHYRMFGEMTTFKPNPQHGTYEARQQSARGAIQCLGGKIAVSGAFIKREIKPAYKLLLGSLATILRDKPDDIVFAKRRIGLDLANEYYYIKTRGADQNPIASSEAIENIDTAWKVVGKPFGPFAKLAASFGNGRL